jgi:hypothetical protein
MSKPANQTTTPRPALVIRVRRLDKKETTGSSQADSN